MACHIRGSTNFLTQGMKALVWKLFFWYFGFLNQDGIYMLFPASLTFLFPVLCWGPRPWKKATQVLNSHALRCQWEWSRKGQKANLHQHRKRGIRREETGKCHKLCRLLSSDMHLWPQSLSKTSACKILQPFDGPKSVHICPKFLMQSSLLRPFASSSASRSPMSMRSPVQQKVSEIEPPPAPEEGALDKDRVSSPMWAA